MFAAIIVLSDIFIATESDERGGTLLFPEMISSFSFVSDVLGMIGFYALVSSCLLIIPLAVVNRACENVKRTASIEWIKQARISGKSAF